MLAQRFRGEVKRLQKDPHPGVRAAALHVLAGLTVGLRFQLGSDERCWAARKPRTAVLNAPGTSKWGR